MKFIRPLLDCSVAIFMGITFGQWQHDVHAGIFMYMVVIVIMMILDRFYPQEV